MPCTSDLSLLLQARAAADDRLSPSHPLLRRPVFSCSHRSPASLSSSTFTTWSTSSGHTRHAGAAPARWLVSKAGIAAARPAGGGVRSLAFAAAPAVPGVCTLRQHAVWAAPQVIAQHREWLEGKEVRGRIYISEQGINAQYGGLRTDAEGYARWLADTQPLFKVGVPGVGCRLRLMRRRCCGVARCACWAQHVVVGCLWVSILRLWLGHAAQP